MTLRGIDISQHQATTPRLTGLGFLIARASIGTSHDTRYAAHIAAARRGGLVVGAYHFGRAMPGASQARAFLEAAGHVDLYALDVEPYWIDPQDHSLGRAVMSAAQARAFIAAVAAAGRPIGLYHSDSGFPSYGQDWNWVAKWSPTPPTRAWSIWQYRGDPLDLDRFDGTADELRALGGIPPAPDSSTEETMIVPQHLAHVVTTRTANLYSGATIAQRLPSTLPKGTRLRKFGGVPGWQFVQVGYAGIQQYAWLKSDDVAADPQPLTLIDGAAVDCTATERELATAKSRIVKAITDLGGTPT